MKPWIRPLVVLLLCGGAFAYLRWKARRLEPPPSVTSFSEFLQWSPEVGYVYRISVDGEHYWVADGESRFMASAPSAYVFDQKGEMVDWTVDQGDDSSFSKWWTLKRDYISPEGAAEWFRTSDKPR